jgi:hypothetical protein
MKEEAKSKYNYRFEFYLMFVSWLVVYGFSISQLYFQVNT